MSGESTWPPHSLPTPKPASPSALSADSARLEEEIKLTAPDRGVLDQVLEDPRVRAKAVGAVRHIPYQDIYYDTPERALLRHALALRVRRSQKGRVVGLKGFGGVEDGVSRRQEWESPLAGDLGSLTDLPMGALREMVTLRVDAATPLEALFTVSVDRRVVVLQLEEGVRGELAVDLGEVVAGDKGVPLCEVEVEGVSGSFVPVQQFAEALAERYRLEAASFSKYSLGLELLGLL
ncbi:MAG: CYTH domain-containing protein [Magnetococcales bacterium]|nr:CYTH domain-containing protein [Magnetococcales bacterium]